MLTVKVQLKETSQSVTYENVINTYQKGDLYCIYTDEEYVYKIPIANIWRIQEDYGEHAPL